MVDHEQYDAGSGIPPEPFNDAGNRSETVRTKRKTILHEILEWVLYILAAFVIASLIQSEVFALTQVNMSSMRETLSEGDQLVMNKMAYRFSEPDHGDIIIFLKDEPSDTFLKRFTIYLSDVGNKLSRDYRRNRLIKRVIGLPGDTLEIRDNVLSVNGIVQDESYARIDPDKGIVYNGIYGDMEPTVIPDGKIFVMGDNRGGSLDSRSFGLVDLAWVEGQAVFRLTPFSKLGILD